MTAGARLDHHAAQRAIVRMLYDPAFAETVRLSPAGSGLAPDVARLVGAIDPRALLADRHRRRRTLGALVEELKASSVIALDESRSLALLESFFASPRFHAAVETDEPLVLALAGWLAGLCESGRLRTPQLPDVIALEEMQARARREAAPVPRHDPAHPPERVRLAPGVMFRQLGADVLETVARVEEVLFELGLVPGMGLATDGPRLALPARDPSRPPLPLLAVPLDAGLSVVVLDDDLAKLLGLLAPAGELPATDLAARAARAGLAPARARALIADLVDEEVLCAAASPGC